MEKIVLVKATDIQELFGVSGNTISNWIDSGDLPEPIRVGKMRYWLKEEILAILNSRIGGHQVTLEDLTAHLEAQNNKIPA